jgi:hypothetical protein
VMTLRLAIRAVPYPHGPVVMGAFRRTRRCRRVGRSRTDLIADRWGAGGAGECGTVPVGAGRCNYRVQQLLALTVTGGVIPFLGHEALYGVGLGGVAVGRAGDCCNAGGGVPYGRSHNGEVLPVVGASVGVVLVVGGNTGIERPLKPITQFYSESGVAVDLVGEDAIARAQKSDDYAVTPVAVELVPRPGRHTPDGVVIAEYCHPPTVITSDGIALNLAAARAADAHAKVVTGDEITRGSGESASGVSGPPPPNPIIPSLTLFTRVFSPRGTPTRRTWYTFRRVVPVGQAGNGEISPVRSWVFL